MKCKMKSKVEIKKEIEFLQGLIKNVKPLPKEYKDITKAQIRKLKWVLGWKLPAYYYCHRCGTVHPKLECPKCGGGFASPVIERYFEDNKDKR